MKPTPLARVTADHGGKDKLVEAVAALIESLGAQGEDDKDALRKRLRAVANAKLLGLHATLSDVKKRHGSKDKLADALAAAEKRAKDAPYRAKLATWTVPRLADRLRAVERRAARAAKAA